jgi:hypothetical protein
LVQRHQKFVHSRAKHSRGPAILQQNVITSALAHHRARKYLQPLLQTQGTRRKNLRRLSRDKKRERFAFEVETHADADMPC